MGLKKDTIISVGDDHTFAAICGGTKNSYQWYRNSDPISNAINSTFSLSNVTGMDVGEYYCIIKNSIVPNLTIFTRPIRLFVKSTTGILDYKALNIKIYPNPVQDNLTIDLEELSNFHDYSIRISSLLGKTVFETNVNKSKYEINTSNWSQRGIYVLQLFDAYKQIVTSKKIILN